MTDLFRSETGERVEYVLIVNGAEILVAAAIIAVLALVAWALGRGQRDG